MQKEIVVFFRDMSEIELVYRVMGLFNADYYFAECYLYQTEFNSFQQSYDIKKYKINYNSKSKLLKIGFSFDKLKEILNLINDYNTTLVIYIGLNNGWNYFISNKNIKLYDFCFDINDNGGSTLRFNSEKYDSESILHNIRVFCS